MSRVISWILAVKSLPFRPTWAPTRTLGPRYTSLPCSSYTSSHPGMPSTCLSHSCFISRDCRALQKETASDGQTNASSKESPCEAISYPEYSSTSCRSSASWISRISMKSLGFLSASIVLDCRSVMTK
eukprot:160086-Hanusia_phi.AAC.1